MVEQYTRDLDWGIVNEIDGGKVPQVLNSVETMVHRH